MLASLPPVPKIHIDSELLSLLNKAENALSRFDGVLSIIGEDPLINHLAIKEAIESLNIDGNTYSLDEYFKNKVILNEQNNTNINNHISASLLGVRLLKDVGKASHILLSLHKELHKDNNFQDAGLFRKSDFSFTENINTNKSKYDAPKPEEISQHINLLENYIGSNVSYPTLVNAALIHAQFEMIHPFAYGNGLVGRLLIHLNLIWKKKITNSSLQISRILKSKRLEYFERLEEIEKNNNWLGWIKFFVRSINDAAELTISFLCQLSSFKKDQYNKNINTSINSIYSLQAFDYIFIRPVFSTTSIISELSLTKQTASIIVNKFLENSLIEDITGRQRNRIFINKKILEILNQ